MSLSTELGLPVSPRRSMWAGIAGLATFAVLAASKKNVFDSAMVAAFLIGFTTCVPLTVPSAGSQEVKNTN